MAQGLFGSNVGGKKPLLPLPPVAPGVVVKLPTPRSVQAPTIHVSTLHASNASLGISTSTTSSSGHVSHWIAPPKPTAPAGSTSSGGGGLFGEITHGVEGFIGHLGNDVIHAALGIPVGLAALMQHPILGVETMAKATWHDWSPLFHGDVRAWWHQTSEHPLAPLLDVASVLTLGAAGAARAASLTAKLADSADATAKVADATAAAARDSGAAIRAPVFKRTRMPGSTATKAGETVGRTDASAQIARASLPSQLRHFANPHKFAHSTYLAMADQLGYKGVEAARFANAATGVDSGANRIYRGAAGSGVELPKELSANPWTRYRQAGLRKAGEKVATSGAGKALRLNHVMGDESAFKNLARVERGGRRAAMHNAITHQLVAVHKIGDLLVNGSVTDVLARLHPGMAKAMQFQSLAVPAEGDFAAQVIKMAKDGYQPMADVSHPEVRQMLSDAMGKAEDTARAAGSTDPAVLAAAKKQAYENFFRQDWSKVMTTENAAHALRDASGNIRAVSKGFKKEGRTLDELMNSHAVARALFHNPTKVWRFALLGLSPRYFVNNFLGNGIMLMAATDPVGLGLAFRQYMKMMHGKESLSALDRETANAMGGTGPLRTIFGEEHGHTGSLVDPSTGKIAADAPKFDKVLGKIPNAYKLTHNFADKPYRYMALIYSMKRMPEYQATYARLRAAGMSVEKAQVQAMTIASENPAVRAIVRQNVNRISGQYHTYTNTERNIRTLVPFYAWDRHIAAHFKDLATRAPYKVAMGAALGSLGQLHLQQIMGNTPDFLQSAIPAKLLTGPLGILGWMVGGNTNGRTGVLNALTLSPYGSIGDLTKTAMGVAGLTPHLRLGESFGAQLNPLVQQAAQQLSGVDMMTGQTLKGGAGGPLAQMYLQTYAHVPQMALLSAMLGQEGSSTTKAGNPTLYEKNLQASLSSWLGLPIRQVNRDTEHHLAQLQAPGGVPKKPRKHSLNFPGL